MIIIYICAVLITLSLSAIFSGMEMAFISFDRFQIELEKRKKTIRSQLINKIIKHPKEFIATMLIGNNISLVIYGIYIGFFFDFFLSYDFWKQYEHSFFILFLQTSFSTLLIIIISEFLPKLIFSLYSYETFSFFVIPIYSIFKFMSPITKLVIWITNYFLKILGYKENNQVEILDKKDLFSFFSKKIQDVEPSKIDYEIKIFHKALDFSEIKARECMIPRKEIIAIDMSTSIDIAKKKLIDNGLSKIIIYKDDIDNIIGYIHYLELFKNPKNFRSILFPVEFVHETMSAKEIMHLLINKRKSIAIILDEYGGTLGLITIEDVLEEFLGDIEDEHDKIQYLEKTINNSEFLFSARLEIDYLNNQYGLNLPVSENYETLGGLIVSYIGNIPKEEETLILENFYFEVKKVSKNRIEEVFIKKLQKIKKN